MTRKFGPKNRCEEEIFAIEELIFDVQYTIQKLMKRANISQKELAKRLGCSAPRVSQILSDEGANVTIETLARVLHALGAECDFGRCVIDDPEVVQTKLIVSTAHQRTLSWAKEAQPAAQQLRAGDSFAGVARQAVQRKRPGIVEAANLNHSVPAEAA